MRMLFRGRSTSTGTTIRSDRFLLLIAVSILMIVSFVEGQQQEGDDDTNASLFITNVLEEDVTLYWVDPNNANNNNEDNGDNLDEEDLTNVGIIPSGDGFKMDTYIGHSFIYEMGGRRYFNEPIIVSENKQTQIFGPTHYQVDCTTTKGKFTAHVLPEWSPFGAARFLHLVRIKYFDGCALNRVVPKFLTQFGISSDYLMRTEYRSKSILDDQPLDGINFKPGYMAYAGSISNSRTTEMFIVMPNTPQHQLNAFGQNPWETPFGYVEMDDVESVVANWYTYGDMSPWGNGPDPQKMYRENGYDEYLKQSFPNLDYIEECVIVSSDFDGFDGILDNEEEL